jgi:uncharacterized membrane protein
MSKWDDQLANHAISTTAANLAERLKVDELITEDVNVIDLVDKIRQLIAYYEICIANVIPSLINIANLNNANSQMTNVMNELNSFISNKNIAHLNNTATHVDATMVQLNALPIPRPHLSEESFSASLIVFKSLVEKSFSEIKSLKDGLENTIAIVSEKSNVQNESLKAIENDIEQHKVSIEAYLTEFKSRFDGFESSFTESLDVSISAGSKRLDDIILEQSGKFTEKLDQQKISGSEIIDKLKENKEQASNLLQIIGNIGITGNYQNIANQEKIAADKWRNIALFLMITMVGVIAITIGISAENGFDWKLALFRIGAALVLAIPATYAAKESSRHRELETYNRKAELELASLDPYLSKLPEATRHKVKEDLTEKFFGLSNSSSKTEDPVTYAALLDLLKTALDKK